MNQLLPDALYTAEQVRELDRITIEEFGTEGFELMTRAGTEAFHKMCQTWPALKEGSLKVQVFCGAGNNGGDGYIIAGLAKQKGIPVTVTALKAPELLKGDAHKAWAFCYSQKVDIQPFSETTTITGDIVVDALLGTGLSGDVSGEYRIAIETINAAGKPVIAVDIPSGLCADTGAILGSAVSATQTVTFIGLKQGLMTAMGPELCGELTYASLDVPIGVFTKQPASCQRISRKKLADLIPQRPKHAHKGLYGHILLVGGNQGMPGAIIMASESALACGAGRVTVATRKEHLMALAIRRPELMAQGVDNSHDLNAMIPGKSVMVIGPGLGQDHWARSLLKTALASPLPLILDADALNLIADDSQLLCDRKSPMILTPHPGEAARLLGTTADKIQKDRFNAAIEISQRFGCTVVLKGAGSLIACGQNLQLCSAGNPGMAVAGMGDILSGVLGALLAQDLEPEQAAALGVWLHSTAADDLAAEQGEIGMLATALIPGIRSRLNRLVNRE
ncbi:NAD(P)H-hydrate dehydratase [Endozoicomonas sp. Mp262]|uniref:NAD(P)H-hydrate dehydratase n=1 Tax=Endozoicomonas sp. Mp262 TaxID=2919499 RepID=UPI0021D90188